MAKKNEVSIWIKARDAASGAFKKLERNLNAAWKTTKQVATGLVTFAAGAAAAAAGLGKLADRGGQYLTVQAAFERGTKGQANALERLQRASDGQIRKFDLMAQYNNALALGSVENVEQFEQMLRISRSLSRSLGIDMAYALESMNTGIARQSARWLDNIGIQVDVAKANADYAAELGKQVSELDELEKKEALRRAAMREGARLADEMGDSSAGAGDAWRTLTTRLQDALDKISTLVAQDENIATFFETFIRGVDALIEKLPQLVKGVTDFALTLSDAMGISDPVVRETMAGFNRSPNQERYAELLERDVDRAGRQFNALEQARRAAEGVGISREERQRFRRQNIDASGIQQILQRRREDAMRDALRQALSPEEIQSLFGESLDSVTEDELKSVLEDTTSRFASLGKALELVQERLTTLATEGGGGAGGGSGSGGGGGPGGIGAPRIDLAGTPDLRPGGWIDSIRRLEAIQRGEDVTGFWAGMPLDLNFAESVSPLGGGVDTEGAAQDFEQMGSAVVGTLGEMTAAGISGGDALEQRLLPALTSLGAQLAGGGILGAAIGAVGGVIGAFMNRDDGPQRVTVEEYGDRAMRQREGEEKGSVTFHLRGEGGLVTLDWLEDQLVELEKRGMNISVVRDGDSS